MVVDEGESITVVATPDEGYVFLGWYLGNSGTLLSTEHTYTTIANDNFSLLAQFGKLQDIAIGSSDGGSASFKDSEEKIVHLLPGEEVTVIAVPDEKYDFLGWFIGNSQEPVSTEATYTFAVSENVSLVAKFNQWPLVSISSGANGSVSFENSAETSLFVQPGEDVTIVAVPDENTDFLGWFVGDSQEPVSTEATYTFTVSENASLVAKFATFKDGYEYVDLGLPSGLKWAAYNVGATKPEEYGGYYAWGETEEKEDYGWETYKWCNGSYDTMTKYCTDSSYGTVDNKTTLDLEDDVAHVKWGGDWRMPNTEEQRELLNECTWKWTTLNGVKGYRVTGPNGNSIFLPAAGYRYGTDIYNRGYYGDCWSSSLDSNSRYYAYSLYFGDYYYDWDLYNRYYGQSVRPVSE